MKTIRKWIVAFYRTLRILSEYIIPQHEYETGIPCPYCGNTSFPVGSSIDGKCYYCTKCFQFTYRRYR